MHTVNSFEELHKLFDNIPFHKYLWIYRGQSKAKWVLKPKVGRKEYYLDSTGLGRFRAWRKQAVAYIDLPENEWEQLAIAQHYGLATFLLDWTENPLVAAFFACYQYPDSDGMIYIHCPSKILMEMSLDSPFILEKIYNDGYEDKIAPSLAYHPKAIDRRIVNQKGVFTIHPNPQKKVVSHEVHDPYIRDNLLKVKIKAHAKKEILETLKKYGIDYRYLFPNLDGLSEFINHETMGIAKNKLDENKE